LSAQEIGAGAGGAIEADNREIHILRVVAISEGLHEVEIGDVVFGVQGVAEEK
jgi:hypothetical protein